MAELTTIARPYAKAAFEFAREQKDLATWSSSLATLSAVTQNEKVDSLLESPVLTAEQKAQSLIDLCGDAVSDNVKNFVGVLASNNRLDAIATISELFEDLKAQQEKFADVKVTSAFTLDAAVEKSLASKLGKTLGSDVSVSTIVDKDLIGGVVIRAGDTVIDSSVKGRLAKLAESLGV